VLRGSGEQLFTVNDGFRLEALRRHLEGLHHWMRIAEEALLRPGGNDLGTSFPRPLSPREAEVAFEAAHGLSAREMGLSLNISPRTAERHLANIFDKLGIGSREELRAFIRAPVPATVPAPDAAADRTEAPRDKSRELLPAPLDTRLGGGDIGRR
jgi:DNA-binding CsgD family transcriptional regulator